MLLRTLTNEIRNLMMSHSILCVFLQWSFIITEVSFSVCKWQHVFLCNYKLLKAAALGVQWKRFSETFRIIQWRKSAIETFFSKVTGFAVKPYWKRFCWRWVFLLIFKASIPWITYVHGYSELSAKNVKYKHLPRYSNFPEGTQ